jgi:ubiquinone biosynthesis UbiH/UbiF/VisC/COQ6 family hydroxylase
MNKDIVVVGAGPAALSFARAMKNSSFKLTLFEQLPENLVATPEYDGRDIALTHSSRALLQNLGIWQVLNETDIHPIEKACVNDGQSPHTLDFDSNTKRYNALGFIVSNHLIRQALYRKVKSQANVAIEFECKVSGVSRTGRGYALNLQDGRSYSTPLLVAAGIPADICDFARVAIVCRMRHDITHARTAFECFHYGHTLAVLGLGDNESSIVVTANTEKANELLGLDDENFSEFVCKNFSYKLGKMELTTMRFSYPLVGVHANQFVMQHVALIGDAAVGMHPVTAHGFNLGLRSANLLARQIIWAAAQGRDYFSEEVLKVYQRKHMPETRLMYYGTNGIVKLFTNDSLPGKLTRKAVLGFSRHYPPIKWIIENKLTDAKTSYC